MVEVVVARYVQAGAQRMELQLVAVGAPISFVGEVAMEFWCSGGVGNCIGNMEPTHRDVCTGGSASGIWIPSLPNMGCVALH